MGLRNLTKEYHNNGFHPFSRLINSFESDFYWADNLASIEEHFKLYPPKKEFLGNNRQALVLMDNLEVRRVWPDYFDEYESIAEREMDEGFGAPCFEIRDLSMTRIAGFTGGKFRDYFDSMEKFGINKETFVPVQSLLLYRHDNDNGLLWIYFLN